MRRLEKIITIIAAPAYGTKETAIIAITTGEGATPSLHAGKQGLLTATFTPSDVTDQNPTWLNSGMVDEVKSLLKPDKPGLEYRY